MRRLARWQLPLTHQYLLKSFSKLRIENGVDDGVEKGVHIPYPGSEDEHGGPRCQVRVAGLYTDGVHDVTGEEGHPTHQEGACRRRKTYGYYIANKFLKQKKKNHDVSLRGFEPTLQELLNNRLHHSACQS